MRKITIKIKNGKVFTDLEGFEGKSCDIFAKNIEKKLEKENIEINIEDKEYKPEYYNEEEIKETNEENDFIF